jgi:hypothetical protein
MAMALHSVPNGAVKVAQKLLPSTGRPFSCRTALLGCAGRVSVDGISFCVLRAKAVVLLKLAIATNAKDAICVCFILKLLSKKNGKDKARTYPGRVIAWRHVLFYISNGCRFLRHNHLAKAGRMSFD